MAEAARWGTYSSVTGISEAKAINESYVSRILRMALPAPDIVEAILAGQADHGLMLERLEWPLPASWEQQRQVLLAFRPGHLDP